MTAIVHGMRRDETSNQVRLAATRALNNSLEFTKANFDKDAERHYIMQVDYFRQMNYLSPSTVHRVHLLILAIDYDDGNTIL